MFEVKSGHYTFLRGPSLVSHFLPVLQIRAQLNLSLQAALLSNVEEMCQHLSLPPPSFVAYFEQNFVECCA